jgi:pimeloyl-ACP methyl ester carboxylesterase
MSYRTMPLLLCAALSMIPAAVDAAKDERIVDDLAYAAPNTLVVVDEARRLNLYCTGSGTPTVVFESGLGDSTKAWGLVQPEISRRTRACSYDRAGLGFSDPSRAPGTSANAVRDLTRLLEAANVAPPYVLVGHSYGGMIAKLFATTNPSKVAGLVLVDPSHEDVGQAIFALDPASRAKNTQYLADLKRCLVADAARFTSDPELQAMCVDQPDPRYSARLNAVARSLAMRPAQVAAWISEMTNVWTESADQVRRERRFLGEMPLIVLTKEPAQPSPDETVELRQRKNAALARQHRQTAGLSSRGQWNVVPDSGHNIQLDQPAAVIEAILQVLTDDLKRSIAR